MIGPQQHMISFDHETNSFNCAIKGARTAPPSHKHKYSSGKVVDRCDRTAYSNLDPAARLTRMETMSPLYHHCKAAQALTSPTDLPADDQHANVAWHRYVYFIERVRY